MQGIQADSHTGTKEAAVSFLLAGLLVSILQRNKTSTQLCRALSQGVRSDHVTVEAAEQMSTRWRSRKASNTASVQA